MFDRNLRSGTGENKSTYGKWAAVEPEENKHDESLTN